MLNRSAYIHMGEKKNLEIKVAKAIMSLAIILCVFVFIDG